MKTRNLLLTAVFAAAAMLPALSALAMMAPSVSEIYGRASDPHMGTVPAVSIDRRANEVFGRASVLPVTGIPGSKSGRTVAVGHGAPKGFGRT